MPRSKSWCCSRVLSFAVGFVFAFVEIVFIFNYRIMTVDDDKTKVSSNVMRNRRNDAVVTTTRMLRDQMLNASNSSITSHDRNVKPRILCWVMTQESNLPNKAKMVKETWGKRCDITLYFSSKTNTSFPTIGVDVPDGRRYLFLKTSKAFEYVYNHHVNDADWFLKADDDTYVIVENLRQFLKDKNTSAPVYYGQIFYRYVEGGYNSGGAGYVLSRESLKRFVTEGPGKSKCTVKKGSEDVAVGRCLSVLGVKVQTTKDSKGRDRFNWDSGFSTFAGRNPSWAKRYTKSNESTSLPSDFPVSFHYINNGMMKALDFVIYNLTVH